MNCKDIIAKKSVIATDFDGTLIKKLDTTWAMSYARAVYGFTGEHPNEAKLLINAVRAGKIARESDNYWTTLVSVLDEKYGIGPEYTDQVLKVVNAIAEPDLRDIRLRDGAAKFLKSIAQTHETALVTGAQRSTVVAVAKSPYVSREIDLIDTFNSIVTADNVCPKKRAYAHVIRHMLVDPKDVAVIEDSASGATAALEAGIPAENLIIFRNPCSQLLQRKALKLSPNSIKSFKELI